MHRRLRALVPAIVLTCALAASIDALVPSSWLPIEASAAQVPEVNEGQRLFDHETFGGNGRTCRTCHSGNDGTISLEEVGERLLEDPSDPLFIHDGLDDLFSGTTRIAAHATILIERELPEGVVLVDDPSASSVVFARGVPSTREHTRSRSRADVRHPKPGSASSGGGRDRSSCAACRPAHGATARRNCRVPADRQAVLFEQGATGLRGWRPSAGASCRAYGLREARPRIFRRCALGPP